MQMWPTPCTLLLREEVVTLHRGVVALSLAAPAIQPGERELPGGLAACRKDRCFCWFWSCLHRKSLIPFLRYCLGGSFVLPHWITNQDKRRKR